MLICILYIPKHLKSEPPQPYIPKEYPKNYQKIPKNSKRIPKKSKQFHNIFLKIPKKFWLALIGRIFFELVDQDLGIRNKWYLVFLHFYNTIS